MSSRWTKAATILSPTIEVCGRKLLPFCLRHRVALEEIDSPILSVEREFTAIDVVNAARILSTHDLSTVRKPLTFMEQFRLGRIRGSKKLLKKEAYKLLLYFSEQSLWPRFWEKEDETSGSNSGIEWHLSVLASLVRNGHSMEDAWTMPESAAIWIHMAHSKAAGSKTEIVSEQEWLAMETYKKSQTQTPK